MFTIADCSGLHGHIKVSPADGTVYVPDKGCGGILPFHEASKQAVAVSEDNGLTWTVLPVSTSTGNGEEDNPADGSHQTKSDPSVGVATDGTLYFGYQANDGQPHIAVSTAKGVTWSKDTDVGAAVINGGPVLNTTFPAVVAGDPGRAAFVFFGSETDGTNFHCGNGEDCSPAPPFPGVWFLYVATTFDGGQTWTTQNVTPGDPIKGGAFTLIATVPVTSYTDTGFASGDVYHVTAVNGQGEGPYCPDVTPVVVVPPNPCATPGVLAVTDLNPNGSDNDSGANTPPD